MKPYWTKNLGVHTIEINGHKVEFNVKASAHVDEYFQLDWDFEPGEEEKLRAQINSGALVPSVVRVYASSIDADDGDDNLGGVLSAGETDLLETIKEHGMVEAALSCARDNTLSLAQKLARYTTTKEQS